MNPATGPHGTPRKAPAVTAETTEDRLRRELAQSSQAQARESLLREECARLRADNRALRRAEARRQSPPSAALYGPATGRALDGRGPRASRSSRLNVIDRLVEYRNHVDGRRRDLGYESPHHDG